MKKYRASITKKPSQPTVHFADARGKLQDSGLCERNLNLLAHAQAIELDIGSRCGGHGFCGGDRIQPLCPPAELSPLTEAERKHLSQEQVEAGWRLGCQCFPQKSEQFIQVKVHYVD